MTTSTGRLTHCKRLTSTRQTVSSGPVHFGSVMKTRNRSGLTLVEILIALTMTLIVLGAMAQAFRFASGEIAEGRAVLELANRLRNVEQLLRRDLAGLTVTNIRPHVDNAPDGYFEYIEGRETDRSVLVAAPVDGYLGDVDDFLAFTSRSLEGQYRGRFFDVVTNPAMPFTRTLLSSFAEVVWYSGVPDANGDGSSASIDTDGNGVVDFDEAIVLYRKVLLIRPDLNNVPDTAADGSEISGFRIIPPADVNSFYQQNDISARPVALMSGQVMMVANSLQDLGDRANRYARATAFPHVVDLDLLGSRLALNAGILTGDEIVLSDIAGFDVQIYSPNSPVEFSGNIVVNPSDIGYSGTDTVAAGGFIDLGTPLGGTGFNLSNSQFTTAPFNRSGPWGYSVGGGVTAAATYCTWFPNYEADGINQDRAQDGFGGMVLIDEGRDGLDNDGINGVDDDGEAETAPPYPFPARGIKVSFRVIEKNTKQVRQTSVIHNFSKM